MTKLNLDKYYTPPELAQYCVEKAKSIIGAENITQFLEPSAGNGVFLPFLDKFLAYDIEPEHPEVIKQNYLTLDLPYLKGRCVIGNPPFGSRLNLAQKFFKKSVELGDYIAFILPISQLWNNNSMYEFDLVYSEDLGKKLYTDRKLHCCFNVYRRGKAINLKPKNKLKAVKIIRQDSKNYASSNFDIRMCYWGNGSAGKILQPNESYSGEYKLKIDPEFKTRVIEVLTKVDWWSELNCIAMLKIQQFHIIKVLKKYIPEIY